MKNKKNPVWKNKSRKTKKHITKTHKKNKNSISRTLISFLTKDLKKGIITHFRVSTKINLHLLIKKVTNKKSKNKNVKKKVERYQKIKFLLRNLEKIESLKSRYSKKVEKK
jgi:hypothetical protein